MIDLCGEDAGTELGVDVEEFHFPGHEVDLFLLIIGIQMLYDRKEGVGACLAPGNSGVRISSQPCEIKKRVACIRKQLSFFISNWVVLFHGEVNLFIHIALA